MQLRKLASSLTHRLRHPAYQNVSKVMTDEELAQLAAENKADGGETINKETTGKTAEELAQIASDQRRRAEIAEAKNKELEAKIPKPEFKPEPKSDPTKTNPEQLSPREQALALRPYQDLDDTQAEQLDKIQKATSLSPAEAKKDPLFTAWNDKYVEAQKKEKAKMGASNGSSDFTPEDGPQVQSGMKRDDHKAIFEKVTGGK